MSAGTRNSSHTLGGGPRRDRYSVASPRPPFSDFRWYQRLIGGPVPWVIPGASRRHRQSTMLDSTAVVPTRAHRTMRARSPASTFVSRRLADLRTVRWGRLRGREATSTRPDDARPIVREGEPLRLPAHGRGVRTDALAVLPCPRQDARPGHTGGRAELVARDRALGTDALGDDGRCPDRLLEQLLPVPHLHAHRDVEPVRCARAPEDRPIGRPRP